MSVFSYSAVDSGGQEARGNVVAQSRAAAVDQVVQKGLTPVSVKEQRVPVKASATAGVPGGRVSQASVEAFSRELANLLAAGVPLSRALHIVSREAAQPAARKQWSAIHDDVVGGMSLAEAMSRWPRSFSAVHVAMVRAGETGGFLDTVLAQIADFRSRERDLKSRVKGALVYPAVLLTLATGVLIFLMVYFIPRFSGVFSEFGAALPALTRAVIAASHAVTRYGLVILVAGTIAIVLARRALQSQAGRRGLEQALLRLPAVGNVMARFALVRFCRMLGMLLGAGVPLVTALKVAKEAIGNQTLADTVGASIEEVQRGAPLAKSLGASARLFPASVTEMVAVAEESGRLDREMVRLAVVYEADLDRQLRILVTLVEPVLLFVMAGIVGTIVIGMLLPVFTLQDFIR